MNRLHCAIAACLAACATFCCTACGGNKGEKSDTPADSMQQVSDSEPYADAPGERTDTVKIAGVTYEITISRSADKSAPVVTDELDNRFYDNTVRVSIKADGSDFFEKTYGKSSFAGYLHNDEEQGTVLLGMAFDAEHTDAHAIRLGAQVGQPGIGEGPAFIVEIPLNGKADGIVRDSNQDTTGDEGITD